VGKEIQQALIESGNPVVDPRSFRRSLGQYATGVTIITTKVGDDRAGVTANSFASVSLDPPLILWSISKTSRSFGLFENCKSFTINILGKDQAPVSQHFSSAETDKFSGVKWSEGFDGVPAIDGAIAIFECTVEARYPGGDHIILLGRVRNFARYEGDPLLFSQGRYGIAEEHPDFVAKETLASLPDKGVKRQELALLPALFEAYRSMSTRFDEHRAAEGVTVAEGRTLAILFARPDISMDELVQTSFLGQREAEDTVATLIERKLVRRDVLERLSLTVEGEKRRLAVRERWLRFQEDELRKIPAGDIEVVRRTLLRLIDVKA
jgi:flavin reductase (DIM6/NTAB) family NADH-FMN oxidoreductase RutF/DNA-binding MarR family transcriptional regulator